VFVFSGGLNNFSREEAKKIARKFGAETSENISSKTDFLVIGANYGSKRRKAESFEIKIISEKEFMDLIKNH
jgi:DNA ligase (NAD+)